MRRSFSNIRMPRSGRLVALGAVFFALAAPSGAEPDFAGRYAQPARFYSQTAVISRRSDGAYDVTIDLDFKGCRGNVALVGRIEDNRLIATRTEAGRETCRLDIRREPPGVHVFEESCAAHHGPECEFSGFLRRKR